MNFQKMESADSVDAADGSQWLFERVLNGNYHCTLRLGGSSKEMDDCGRYLIGLSRLNIPEKDMY